MNLDDLLMGLRNQRLQQRTPITTRRQTTAGPAQAAPKRMPGQDAVDFGRSFTGGNGPGPDAVDRLSRDVFARLSTKGLYKDQSGSWQIRGMERPDVTRQIRDAAVAGMGGQDWSRLVNQADQRAAGPAANMSRNTSGVPSPGLGGVPSFPKQSADPYGVGAKLSGLGQSISSGVKNQIAGVQAATQQPRQPQAPSGPSVGSIQSVVESSLRSRGQTPPTSGPLTTPVPTSGPNTGPVRTATPDWVPGRSGQSLGPTTGGGIQTPTQANVAQGNLQPTGGAPSPFPPQGQGVGRTTTPTGSQVSPSQYPTTYTGGQGEGVVALPNTGASNPGLDAATNNIIAQETGGATWTPNNTNCSIRPAAGCLDLNTGIYQATAQEAGIDWNRLMTDPSYAPQAVGQLLTGYASDDAGQWNGPAGMTVWDYGEQNLPGGGWEAVARVYFGGDVTGQYVDEQGRSGVQYGQEFIAKMGGAAPGMPPPYATGGPTTGQQNIVAGPASGTSYPIGSVATGAPAPAMDTSYSGSLSAATTPFGPQSGETFNPQFIVYHYTDGSSFNGAGSYDQNGDGIPDGSTNYVIDKDGTIYEIVPPGSAMPWANGQTQGMAGVNPEKKALYDAAQQGNLNSASISIEMVGLQGEPLTPEQLPAGQQLTAYLSGQYSIPLDDQHLVGHSDIAGLQDGSSNARMDPYPNYSPMDMVPTGPVGQPTVQQAPTQQAPLVVLRPGLSPVPDYRNPGDPGYGTNFDGTPGIMPPNQGQPSATPSGNVPISQDQLNAIGAGSGAYPSLTNPNGTLSPSTLSAIGAGSGTNYVPGGGQAMNIAAPPAGQPIASTPQQYVPAITQAASQYGVPPNILSALLQAESNWDPNATNPSSGAQGLGQFMPGTASGLGINAYDPNQAIYGAAQYLRQMYDMFGSWELALAAYNAGPGNVMTYGGIPPFAETQSYVTKILGLAGPY